MTTERNIIGITPSLVSGRTRAPASKSVAQRAIAIASLCPGRSEIWFPGACDDVLAAIQVCRTMGADIQGGEDFLVVEGGLRAPLAPLQCGESGLGIRMFAGLAASFNRMVALNASGSLLKRPMHVVEESLHALGVDCKTNNGYPPICVKGPIRGGKSIIDGSQSSQVLSGILIASPLAMSDVHLVVENLKSIPYIDVTIRVMEAFGVTLENRDYKEFIIPAHQVYQPQDFRVEGDWSGGAFLLVAGAIAGSITVDNLDIKSAQADKKILEALKAAGAKIVTGTTRTGQKYISVTRKDLRAFDFDATHCPDLFPPLVALAANCSGTSRIHGISRLKNKESDRAATLADIFGNTGVPIRFEDDTMLVTGGNLEGGRISSHGDHRIAMAGALAALNSRLGVLIENPGVVNKSYPDFFKDLEALTL
jgi:3-phosphoshikimate 1-carboxyvinyltransferase